jgi:hypothetical protein
MRFEMIKARNVRMTEDQVAAIIRISNERNLPMIALTQAFQFDCGLSQKDCLGEYVPADEPGDDTYVFDGYKWLWGLRWENIDTEKWLLRYLPSAGGDPVTLHLSDAPLVMAELKALLGKPKKGPVIVDANGKPYDANAFRRLWRMIANEAGIPKEVRNMDSKRGTDASDEDSPEASDDAG